MEYIDMIKCPLQWKIKHFASIVCLDVWGSQSLPRVMWSLWISTYCSLCNVCLCIISDLEFQIAVSLSWVGFSRLHFSFTTASSRLWRTTDIRKTLWVFSACPQSVYYYWLESSFCARGISSMFIHYSSAAGAHKFRFLLLWRNQNT